MLGQKALNDNKAKPEIQKHSGHGAGRHKSSEKA